MTTTPRKNWKSEIAWLRTLATRCYNLSMLCSSIDYSFPSEDISAEAEAISMLLSARADTLEKAKTPPSP